MLGSPVYLACTLKVHSECWHKIVIGSPAVQKAQSFFYIHLPLKSLTTEYQDQSSHFLVFLILFVYEFVYCFVCCLIDNGTNECMKLFGESYAVRYLQI